jgi:poly-gamma-glutamate synthesis protein (capsule biosynthesis protein)
MANLAKNHMMDFYERGLDDTMALLDEAGIVYSGAGRNLEEARKPAMMEVKGLKTAMLGYTDMAELVFAGEPYFEFVAKENKHGVAPRKIEYILEDVGKIRNSVDLVIVSLHWGVEETFTITKEMVEFAHTLIDSGVDIILGHHPHQFQGMEIYNGKPIIYSMGNFIMDQNDPENQEGFILIFQYRDTEFINLKAIPVRTEEKTQVVLQEGEGALNILQREKRLCEELGTIFEIVDGNLVYEME